MKHFEVIVIGGGHAGVEAACASARMGLSTALITHRFDRIGEMSCNPAIGGLGKGHLVREVDALDGVIGRIADKAAIQYRLLNRSKGPAVQGPRSQIDRVLYRQAMQNEIRSTQNLTIIEDEVFCFNIQGGRILAVIISDKVEIFGEQFILTTGTFLGGVIHIGEETISAGRMGDPSSINLSNQLHEMNLPIGRLKTGTPPRLVSNTIDWDKVDRQEADSDPVYFSTLTNQQFQTQIACGITSTNSTTHDIIRDNLDKSAMYSGNITGTGPRYCPSIEDKISRFSDKESHQVFLEPEGLNNPLVYPNGISTSLPRDVQLDYVRSMQGLESVKIDQYGYAIEYDYIDPKSLRTDLSLKTVENLFFAGQINGTTGYEEAAAQGLVAGLNASLRLCGEAPADFTRANSYIGVLVDDLISRGVSEPYRMFTSRAEYRLSIRADNADQRLTPMAISYGLVSKERQQVFEDKIEQLDKLRTYCQTTQISPNEAKKIDLEVRLDGRKRNLNDLLAFPNIDAEHLKKHFEMLNCASPSILRQIEIEAIYAHYIERQNKDIVQFERDRSLIIPQGFDFRAVKGLSNELLQKLETKRPENIAEATTIEGITPAALTLIAAYLRKRSVV